MMDIVQFEYNNQAVEVEDGKEEILRKRVVEKALELDDPFKERNSSITRVYARVALKLLKRGQIYITDFDLANERLSGQDVTKHDLDGVAGVIGRIKNLFEMDCPELMPVVFCKSEAKKLLVKDKDRYWVIPEYATYEKVRLSLPLFAKAPADALYFATGNDDLAYRASLELSQKQLEGQNKAFEARVKKVTTVELLNHFEDREEYQRFISEE